MEISSQGRIKLPSISAGRELTVEAAIERRRSVREFSAHPLNLNEVSQILWAAQGTTNQSGYRSAPSAGALYPLETLLVAGEVRALRPGLYRYDPKVHDLQLAVEGDLRAVVAQAALSQEWIAAAPTILVLAAVPERTTAKYGDRGIRYVHIEAGHAAQNVYLQAAALALGTTIVGAFRDQELADVLGLRAGETPVCLLPVGHL